MCHIIVKQTSVFSLAHNNFGKNSTFHKKRQRKQQNIFVQHSQFIYRKLLHTVSPSLPRHETLAHLSFLVPDSSVEVFAL